MTEDTRPHGEITVVDERGYAYLPLLLRREIAKTGKGSKGTIPFYLNANIALLVREGATREDVLKGLDILKEDLKLRWKEEKKNG